MTFTVADDGNLVIHADAKDLEQIEEIEARHGQGTYASECEALEGLTSNGLSWISAADVGALTDAPLLGMLDEGGQPERVWGFMDYQIRSFLEDLKAKGETVFQKGS